MVVQTSQWLLTQGERERLFGTKAKSYGEVLNEAQLRKVAEKQEELCFYYLDVGGSGPVMRGHCDHCRQALRKEAGLDA